MLKDFGLVGLGVMGKSLCLNLAERGFSLALFNRHIPSKEENIAVNFVNTEVILSSCSGYDILEKFVNDLQRPRKIMLMVNAGRPVDEVIEQLKPLLQEGDCIIDGGNSHYEDTRRRSEDLSSLGIHYIGAGVSGGEEGARKGPSIMPGGQYTAYEHVRPYLEAISARDENGDYCCAFVGPDGAGHFVKMIHNGIEYAEMQLIAEVCDLILKTNEFTPEKLADLWEATLTPSSRSYLIEITLSILRHHENGQPLIYQILDKAGNKGTGNWATIAACELGVAATMMSSALYARFISSYMDKRLVYAQTLPLKRPAFDMEKIDLAGLLRGLYAARWVNHHQGFQIIRQASIDYKWDINLSEIARIWTNGCIIRSGMMGESVEVLRKNEYLMDDQHIAAIIQNHYPDLLHTVQYALNAAVSIPAHLSAIDYLHGITSPRSSAYIIQAQRDYFGAHTFERIGDPSGKSYHSTWK